MKWFPLFLVWLAACSGAASTPNQNQPTTVTVTTGSTPTPARPVFDAPRRATAGEEFRRHWHDGQAEMNGYRITTPRYGELRTGELALIYVTEPHDRRTWIKDDRAEGPDRVEVLKLNLSLQFQTGVYPYSILTSVFVPTGDYGLRRFSPTKITTTVQEWCGHVFHGVWPGTDRFAEQLISYFASEGESATDVEVTSGNVVYEDALLIQLRELDGAFAEGGNYEGQIVPALWHARRAHQPLRPVDGTITRETVEESGRTFTRFTLRYGDYVRTYDVDADYPHRIRGWRTEEGEVAELIRSVRQPYWSLNHNRDEVRRQEFMQP